MPVSWNLPAQGWIKVNIDGSARGAPGRSGCGGVFRTSRGFVKGCFSVFLGIKYAFEAELFGFMIAMEIAEKFGWNTLWLETDSTYVVLLVKNNSQKVPWRFRSRWIRALQFARKNNVRISHIYREGNCVADKLASMSITEDSNHWWFQAPEDLQRLLYRDLIPLPFYRFRNLHF